MGAMVDVVVVGAGPAGCATALHLARRGVPSVVVDRSRFPREKVCGEGLMPHGVHELDVLGLVPAVRAQGAPWFTGIAYHSDRHTAIGRFPPCELGNRGIGVRRLRFDRVLLDAVEADDRIDLRIGRRVRAVRVDGDGVTVGTDDGPIRARVVVGADGLGSVVRRELGLQRKVRDVPRYGARLHFAVDCDPGDLVEVYLARGHELYVTPVGPREVNVALLCGKDLSRSFAGDLTQKLAAFLRSFEPLRPLLDGAVPVNEGLLCGPLRQAVSRPVADRALLVGDAAGFIDGITGEGMSLTLLSARLAADTLAHQLERDALSAADLAIYARRKHDASRDLVWLTELVLFGLRRPAIGRWLVRNLARHPETFGRFLAVNAGQRPLLGLPIRDFVRAGLGV